MLQYVEYYIIQMSHFELLYSRSVKLILVQGQHTAQFNLQWAGPVQTLHNNTLPVLARGPYV